MIGKRTEEGKPVTLAEVSELLGARAVQPDFGYEQQTSLDYAKKFAKLTKGKAEELVGKMMEFEGMKIEAAVKIADIMPSHKSQYAPVLSNYKVSLPEKEMAKLMELVNSYRQ